MRTSQTPPAATVALVSRMPFAPAASAYVPKPWVYKTPKLNKAQVDALLAQPEKLLILDVRRPDEIAKWGPAIKAAGQYAD